MAMKAKLPIRTLMEQISPPGWFLFPFWVRLTVSRRSLSWRCSLSARRLKIEVMSRGGGNKSINTDKLDEQHLLVAVTAILIVEHRLLGSSSLPRIDWHVDSGVSWNIKPDTGGMPSRRWICFLAGSYIYSRVVWYIGTFLRSLLRSTSHR